jgi:hypothetical protein
MNLNSLSYKDLTDNDLVGYDPWKYFSIQLKNFQLATMVC